MIVPTNKMTTKSRARRRTLAEAVSRTLPLLVLALLGVTVRGSFVGPLVGAGVRVAGRKIAQKGIQKGGQLGARRFSSSANKPPSKPPSNAFHLDNTSLPIPTSKFATPLAARRKADVVSYYYKSHLDKELQGINKGFKLPGSNLKLSPNAQMYLSQGKTMQDFARLAFAKAAKKSVPDVPKVTNAPGIGKVVAAAGIMAGAVAGTLHGSEKLNQRQSTVPLTHDSIMRTLHDGIKRRTSSSPADPVTPLPTLTLPTLSRRSTNADSSGSSRSNSSGSTGGSDSTGGSGPTGGSGATGGGDSSSKDSESEVSPDADFFGF